jgi:GT2 family glycosyltransferase
LNAKPPQSSATEGGISVVIVNWHSEALLAETLAALNAQTRPPEHVVVVDNGSHKPIPVERYTAGPIVVRRMGRNEGFARANNLALLENVDTAWVALLNPDAIPEPDWLEQLARAAESYPEVAAFGSQQRMAERPDYLDGLGDDYHVSGAAWRVGYGLRAVGIPSEPFEIFSPCAAAALYKRRVVIDVGGFDEDFFCYFEDVDLGFRLRLSGHSCLLVPAAIVRHVGSATTGGRQSDFAVYHGHRNLVWAYIKNMPGYLFWVHLFQHLLFDFAGLVYFGIRGQAATIFKAKLHALLGVRAAWRKRSGIQRQRRVKPSQLAMQMRHGWLTPYTRRYQLGIRPAYQPK